MASGGPVKVHSLEDLSETSQISLKLQIKFQQLTYGAFLGCPGTSGSCTHSQPGRYVKIAWESSDHLEPGDLLATATNDQAHHVVRYHHLFGLLGLVRCFKVTSDAGLLFLNNWSMWFPQL